VQTRAGAGFRLLRVAGAEPYIVHLAVSPTLTTFTEDEFARIEAAFFSGEPPRQAATRLRILSENPRFNCRQFCDRYYYTWALALELSGETRPAIDQYIDLWWNHSTSPFTQMARLKLQTRTTAPTMRPTNTPFPGQPTLPVQPTAPYPLNTPVFWPTPTPYP
jgi:hypothetical protein